MIYTYFLLMFILWFWNLQKKYRKEKDSKNIAVVKKSESKLIAGVRVHGMNPKTS